MRVRSIFGDNQSAPVFNPFIPNNIGFTMGWSCSACTYNNANMASTACEICGTARPAQAAAAPVVKAQGTGWACHQCTYVNVPLATRCAICDSVRADDMMMIDDDDEKMPPSTSPVSRLNAIDLTGSPAPQRPVANGVAVSQNAMKLPSELEAKRLLAEAQAKEQERIQKEQVLKSKLKEQRMRDLAERKEEIAREKRELAKKKDAERFESTKQLFEMEKRHQEELRLAKERRSQVEQSLLDIPSAIRFVHERYGMEAVKDVLSLISKILFNIIRSPNEEKFRMILTSSPSFQNRIESRLGASVLMKLLGFQYQQLEDGTGQKREALFMASPNLTFLQTEYEKMMALLNRPETRLHTYLPPPSQNEDIPLLFLMSFRQVLDNIVVAPTSCVAGKIDRRSDIYKAFFAAFAPAASVLKEFDFEFQDVFWTWKGKNLIKLQRGVRDLDKEILKRLSNCSIVKALDYVSGHNSRSATSALVEKVQAVLTNIVNDMHQTSRHVVPLQPLLKLTGPIDGLREFLTALGFHVDPELKIARVPYPYQNGIEPYRLGLEIVQVAWKRILKSLR